MIGQSGMDLLPAEAGEAVHAALAAVQSGKAMRIDIYAELSKRLDDLDITPPSRSAFYRWAARESRPAVAKPELLDLLRPKTRALVISALSAVMADLERVKR
jgi:hypothetical protein